MTCAFKTGKSYITRGGKKAVFVCDAKAFGGSEEDSLIFIIDGDIHHHHLCGHFYLDENNSLDIVGEWVDLINIGVTVNEYKDGSIALDTNPGIFLRSSNFKRQFKATLTEIREP